MNKYLIFSVFIILQVKSYSSIFTNFSLINQNGNYYQFQIVSSISFGAGASCPNLYPTTDSLSNDTIYIRSLYDFTGVWQQMGCLAVDTTNFTNIYPSANYINLSVGYYQENTANPNIDTFWSVHDTVIQIINPLSTIHSFLYMPNISIHPNPCYTQLTIKFKNTNERHASLQIFDMLGRNIISIIPPKTKETIVDVSYLPNGLYYLKYDDQIQKVIKQ